jgi:molybdopterin molybdotransferase
LSHTPLRPIASALGEITDAFRPLSHERVGLGEAAGRVLAGDVFARADLPAFTNSAMDGYAVRAADTAGASEDAPITLRVAGESRAGGASPAALEPGTATRIFTGARVPENADAVVMQEDTDRDGDSVSIRLAAHSGKHVRTQGEDVKTGSLLLESGTVLQPGEIGILAGQRHGSVSVTRRPRVALLSTGDELRDISDPVEPGTIVNSNAYALAAQVREAGGIPWVLPIAPDDPKCIEDLVRDALGACDVLISIGGVSVGEYDFVRGALESAGVEPRFWKIAIKPGKPVSFGVKGTLPVIGLPGNPISAMLTFEVFVRPGLRKMQGDPNPYRPVAQVTLGHAHTHKTGRTELARARLTGGADGPMAATLLTRQGSGSLPSMIGVDALVILDSEQRGFDAGAPLKALLIRDSRGVAQPPFPSE